MSYSLRGSCPPATPTVAAPTAGSGSGYYGSVDYVGNFGSMVGPCGTYSECNTVLQNTIAHNVDNSNDTVETVYPCSYTPPFAHADHEIGIRVEAATPDGSYDDAVGVLAEITRLRGRYGVERFEAELGAFYRRGRVDLANPGRGGDAGPAGAIELANRAGSAVRHTAPRHAGAASSDATSRCCASFFPPVDASVTWQPRCLTTPSDPVFSAGRRDAMRPIGAAFLDHSTSIFLSI